MSFSNIMVVTVNVSSFMSYLIINVADSVEGWVLPLTESTTLIYRIIEERNFVEI